MDITNTEPVMTAIVDIADWVLVERGGYRLLVGRITGHPKIADGRWAVTSVVVEMSRQQARTRNTVYRPGPMMADDADLSDLPPKVREMILPAKSEDMRLSM